MKPAPSAAARSVATLPHLLEALETAIQQADNGDVPQLLAALSRLQALAVLRLLPPPVPPPQLLTTRETARLLRRSLDHVFDLVRRRELEPIRLPNGFRFKRQDVERYLAERADPD